MALLSAMPGKATDPTASVLGRHPEIARACDAGA